MSSLEGSDIVVDMAQVEDILWECERESERCLGSLMRMGLTCSYPYKEQKQVQREELGM